MATSDRSHTRTDLVRYGFGHVDAAEAALDELALLCGIDRDAILSGVVTVGDPDAALTGILRVARRHAAAVAPVLTDHRGAAALWALTGASEGFADFYFRRPAQLADLLGREPTVPDAAELTHELLASVEAVDGFAADGGEASWVALRVRYRTLLARIAAYDLLTPDAPAHVDLVAAALADAAGAALEASLAVARTRLSASMFPRDDVAAVALAIIGMGKTGARELNYVSDVDVIFVGDADDVTRENVLAADEVVKLVRVPKPRGDVRATYLKFRERDSYDFALASVALTLWMDGDKVRDARIVLGGVAPIPWRAAGAEDRMKGAAMGLDAWKACAAEAVKGADPLEHNEFKIPLTQGLIVRAMERLA